MAIKLVNAEYRATKRYAPGKTTSLDVYVYPETKTYSIQKGREEHVDFDCNKSLEDDIATAKLVYETLLFIKRNFKSVIK